MSALLTARDSRTHLLGLAPVGSAQAKDFFADTLNLRSAVESAATVTDPLIAAAKRALGVLGPVETAALPHQHQYRPGDRQGHRRTRPALDRQGRLVALQRRAVGRQPVRPSRPEGRPGDRLVGLRQDLPAGAEDLRREPSRDQEEPGPVLGRDAGRQGLGGLVDAAPGGLPVPAGTVEPDRAGRRHRGAVQPGCRHVAENPRTVQGEVLVETTAETVLVDGEPHTVMPVSGTATVTGPRGGKTEVPITGVAVPTDAAERLPETMADVVVTAEPTVPDGRSRTTWSRSCRTVRRSGRPRSWRRRAARHRPTVGARPWASGTVR